MLLPSALPCNVHHTPFSQPNRPKLTSPAPYRPAQHPATAATSLLASCRALQAILGHAPAPAAALPSSRLAPSTRRHQSRAQSGLRNEWYGDTDTKDSPSPPGPAHCPPRGLHKRRRNEFEEDQDMPDRPEEKENFESIYVTPKRHRKAPLLIPLGLSAEDFNALEDPSTDHDEPVSLPPAGSEATQSTQEESWTLGEFGNWTAADDRLLVETVLGKLKLSKREWNDCARRLGKDKDTLGKRWKMLVVEGNVGLRRGGRLRRTDLDIESW